MLSRIKALVASGMRVGFSGLESVEGGTIFSVCIFDSSRDCHLVASEYDWQNNGNADATIESAVSQAERYLARKADDALKTEEVSP